MVFGDLDHYKIVVPLFGAAYATPNKGTTNLSLTLYHSRRVVVSYKRKYMYVHEVMVNCLFKLAQEKVWLGELTVPQ